ncbi:Beta-glucuronosyltransferase GlcAT14B [Camellia lanceoleosa]|uniref:Beta-glucuronosyltransferase GlcAT14B n=1 Tax=Camellia lanceoleosa TaxID=1840588 RepID=A0ACC0HWP8_9ERIC|nr:Beta-glucuronosyltransferase GlcAT14B [Camellia lanceoleosa]
MVDSNAPFARKFHQDDPVLDKIDSELLFRGQDILLLVGGASEAEKMGPIHALLWKDIIAIVGVVKWIFDDINCEWAPQSPVPPKEGGKNKRK